ncbi:vacuolar protein sorting-associated protein 52 homolog isoform X2 [Haemorhous mexicanus]|uniref:vacuolar protein sorting-associated protein 52 homolog isoform X2 n=1 Tax=Haemorhous mexicanus TaxID=30427 RepID=UPI0028BF4412|nr:vacuolar protein sorting-associated protein 52 homolog isoform X2 [Haemorhous mexicanus]
MAAQAEVAAMEAPLEAELEAELDLEGAELEEVDVHIQENLEDALVQEALQTGVDLRQYSRQVELELQEVERASIQDYIRESENIAELHNQISACDAILQRMEEMLGSFQSSLSSLSWEIRALQGQAGAMNLRLRNRREVRERLGGLLDELVVPPEMISVILESPVTSPEFQAQLRALDSQLGAVKDAAFRDTLACADVQARPRPPPASRSGTPQFTPKIPKIPAQKSWELPPKNPQNPSPKILGITPKKNPQNPSPKILGITPKKSPNSQPKKSQNCPKSPKSQFKNPGNYPKKSPNL